MYCSMIQQLNIDSNYVTFPLLTILEVDLVHRHHVVLYSTLHLGAPLFLRDAVRPLFSLAAAALSGCPCNPNGYRLSTWFGFGLVP